MTINTNQLQTISCFPVLYDIFLYNKYHSISFYLFLLKDNTWPPLWYNNCAGPDGIALCWCLGWLEDKSFNWWNDTLHKDLAFLPEKETHMYNINISKFLIFKIINIHLIKWQLVFDFCQYKDLSTKETCYSPQSMVSVKFLSVSIKI